MGVANRAKFLPRTAKIGDACVHRIDLFDILQQNNTNMNTQPTPETDEESYDDPTPGYPVVRADFARRLERERDEARKRLTGIEIVMRAELGGHPDSELWGDAGLIAATMRCVDALGEITEQRDEAREQRDEALHQMEKYAAEAKLAIEAHESACRERNEAQEQRDRLAEVLHRAIRETVDD